MSLRTLPGRRSFGRLGVEAEQQRRKPRQYGQLLHHILPRRLLFSNKLVNLRDVANPSPAFARKELTAEKLFWRTNGVGKCLIVGKSRTAVAVAAANPTSEEALMAASGVNAGWVRAQNARSLFLWAAPPYSAIATAAAVVRRFRLHNGQL